MKKTILVVLGLFIFLMTDGWCQSPQPSGPGDTLKRSQDTMEYYKLEQKLQKDQRRLKEKTESSEEKPGNQKDIEINEDDNQVIRYTDEKKPGSE